MTLENQVVSLDLAKKLKELGVKEESLWHWWLYPKNHPVMGDLLEENRWCLVDFKDGDFTESDKKRGYSAFTVAELGEMLPRLTNYRIWQQHSTDTSKLGGKWAITVNDVREDKFTDLTADTEADARTKMLIYLLENKLISAP